jgi:UDP-N-acetylglucosamine acyltransferase
MATEIAATAIVDPRARLGRDVKIGHYCVIGPESIIGDDCILESHVVVMGRVTIGQDNHFFPGCVIGGYPQDTGYKGAPTAVEIGDGNMFREHCTVNRGTEKEEGLTYVGHNNYLMACTHVAHDCRLGDRIVIANNGMLGGHVHVGNDVTIAGGVGVNHFASIGQLSFVSAMSRVLHDVPPYTVVDGQPAKPRSVNTVGLKRHGYPEEDLDILGLAFRLLYRDRVGIDKARQEVFAAGPIRPVIKHLFDTIDYACGGRAGRGRDRRGKVAA